MTCSCEMYQEKKLPAETTDCWWAVLHARKMTPEDFNRINESLPWKAVLLEDSPEVRPYPSHGQVSCPNVFPQ